jgi:cytochrome P450
MVFSQGPRGCPGRALAWAEMFFMTVSLLQRYNMELSPGQEHLGDSPSTYFLTKPKTKSLYLKLSHRVK